MIESPDPRHLVAGRPGRPHSAPLRDRDWEHRAPDPDALRSSFIPRESSTDGMAGSGDCEQFCMCRVLESISFTDRSTRWTRREQGHQEALAGHGVPSFKTIQIFLSRSYCSSMDLPHCRAS